MRQTIKNLFKFYISEWKEVRRTYTPSRINRVYSDNLYQQEVQEALYGFTTIEYIDQKGDTKFVRVLGNQIY